MIVDNCNIFSSAIFSQKFAFSTPSDNLNQENLCRLSLFVPSLELENWIAPQVVLLTQISENIGFSVSNSIEHIAPQAIRYLQKKVTKFNLDNCVIVEHHNSYSYPNYDEFLEEYDMFKYDMGHCFWKNLEKEEFAHLIKGQKILGYDEIPDSFYFRNWSKNKIQKTYKFLSSFVNLN